MAGTLEQGVQRVKWSTRQQDNGWEIWSPQPSQSRGPTLHQAPNSVFFKRISEKTKTINIILSGKKVKHSV